MLKTIYHTQLNSPWGPVLLVGTGKAICACEFVDGKNVSNLLARVQKQNCDSLLQEDPTPLAGAMEGLNRYFLGEPEVLDHPLNLLGTQFQNEVWSALRKIPLGGVATYGDIAARIGRPGGARAVGQACGANPALLFVPCHRVVAAGGKLGGFGGGLALKEALLRHEGVNVR